MRTQKGSFDLFQKTIEILDGNGALLVSGSPPNAMTIGWGTIGIIWGRPIFIVYVRPTRYTYQLMEKSEDFSVNFLLGKYSAEIGICGARSGRDTDKISRCNFTMVKGLLIPTPYIAESDFHYECRIIERNTLDPGTLDQLIINRYYPIKDFHRLYFGEILGVFSE
ncbi:MAG: flavin reductase family protein [Bacteroidetes bacterium]|nr:flavin reductase family protein [Bacteroidota bacterium]